MSSAAQAFRLEVPCDLNAPRIVRAALSATHDGGWSLDDGLLVASELVTNAVQHSGGEGTQRLDVQVGRRAGNLLISVHDPGISGKAAKPAKDEPSGSGGRGLQIVERLSVRWGSERPDGYCVWAELPVHTPGY
jgi:anti-sigma regulatory factor (Ser/Thr protein kinase)